MQIRFNTTEALNFAQDTMRNWDAKVKSSMYQFCENNPSIFCKGFVHDKKGFIHDKVLSNTVSLGSAILGGGLIASGYADALSGLGGRTGRLRECGVGVSKMLLGSVTIYASTFSENTKGLILLSSVVLGMVTAFKRTKIHN